MVAFEGLDEFDVASDESFDTAATFFPDTNPILSKSLALSSEDKDGLRNNPLREARGFTVRAEKVLLPDLRAGRALFTGLGDLSRTEEPKFGSLDWTLLGGGMLRAVEGVLEDLAVLGRFKGVYVETEDCGCLNVFVEALKSRGIDLTEPDPEPDPALEVGLLTARDGGRIGLSLLKKLDRLLRTAGEDGIFCSVSIVRSEREGRGLLGRPCCASSSTTVPICSSITSSLGSCFISRKVGREGFLNIASPLGFLRRVCGGGLCITVPVEASRSRERIDSLL